MLLGTKVENLVQRAWRRRLLVLSIDQSALALAVVFGGLVLLIILGTQILAWPWLLAIAVAGVGLSVTGIRRRLADRYSVAQMLDRRLSFSDAMSTAWFLRHSGESHTSQAAARQISYAEALAETADPALAFPFERQRLWVVTGLLCLLVAGLFSARYLVTRDLSLRQTFLPLSLTQAVENTLHAATGKHQQDRQITADAKMPSLPPSPLEQAVEHAKQEQQAGQNPDPAQPLQSKPAGGDGNGAPSSEQNQDQSKQSGADSSNAKHANAGQGQKGADAADGKQTPNSNPQDGKQQQSNGPQRSENLMARMRDALSSVMAKIKPSGKPDAQQGSQKDGEGKKNSEQSGSKDQNAGDSQKDSSEKEQSATEQASGQQQGQGAAKAQTSGKDSAQASDKNGSDAQSGVGHLDGDKDIKAAEQAKAMGKLAEIIGKRSAALTGDMRVEPSGKQHLQTAYTNQQGQHADTGGEINRDEVPVEDQEYVREYMELVRKESARKRAQKGTASH